MLVCQAKVQLVPDLLIGHRIDIELGIDLKIKTADTGPTVRTYCKPPFGVPKSARFNVGFGFSKDTEPREWEFLDEAVGFRVGDMLADNAVKSVAAGHEIAVNFMPFAVLGVMDDRRAFGVRYRFNLCIEYERKTVTLTQMNQIFHDLVLAVGCQSAATVSHHRNRVTLASPEQFHVLMRECLRD